MRFLSNGPSIPDELLLARDEGRVVFFCGAGVSRARANLTDFFGLAETVLAKLRVPGDHAARKLLAEANSIEERTGVAGLISADRVFSLLGRDFTSTDVERSVAEALRPTDDVDVSAHEILVALARTQDGALRLVTTNFDRLFEKCTTGSAVWCGPRLPDPTRPNEMTGLIYLHGRVTDDYAGAESEGFVLSSSEFGRAYLSEAWATHFVRAVLDRYVVVFVGYSADDPPIQYLLEALSVQAATPHGVYAFQEGLSSEATGRWLHKGVHAIAYEPDTNHVALWETLAAWAERAQDPAGWHRSVISLATKGPQQLMPHQRGQVAHIVSTAEGARLFSSNDPPPPADWLCTFDSRQRYATPSSDWSDLQEGPTVDPFPLFSLDSDPVPEHGDPSQRHRDREVPGDAWNGLRANRRDLIDAPDEHSSSVYGFGSVVPARPAVRLQHLGSWIAAVSPQAAAPWWAAKNGGLHPDIQRRIQWRLERSGADAEAVNPLIRKAWQYLIESWNDIREPDSRDWYALKGRIAIDGWDLSTVRRFADHFRPYLVVKPSWLTAPTPPETRDDLRLSEIVSLDVEYREAVDKEPIPTEYLWPVIKLLRQNLELAVRLEQELGGHGLNNLSPINRDDSGDIDGFQRSHGLSGALIHFATLYDELVASEIESARAEFRLWPSGSDPVFAQLRIWAVSNPKIASPDEFSSLVADLTDDTFWDSQLQRDLLLGIGARWPDLPPTARAAIERRLTSDASEWEGFDAADVQRRKAWQMLSRIEWLRKKGCKFSEKLLNKEKELRKVVPDWSDAAAEKAASSTEARGGVVRTDTTYDMLLTTDLGRTLEAAEAAKGRTEDFLVEVDPFQGLAAERPARALGALMRAAREGRIVDWAWRAFLSSEARTVDSPRMDRLLAERLVSFPTSAVAEFVRAASNWLKGIAGRLAPQSPVTFGLLVSKLSTVIGEYPEKAGSALVRSSDAPDWVTEAINSPAGKIAESLMEDPRKNDLKSGQGFDESWLQLAERILTLPGDHGRYALVIFCFNLDWFYAVDPAWTAKHLIVAVESDDDLDRDAFWSGFLWGARVPHRELFVVLKPHLIRFATEGTFARRGYGDVLAGVVLAGWGTVVEGDRLVSDAEMQKVLLNADETFRSKVLRQMRMWIGRVDAGERPNWKELAPRFFESVWPRQKFIRTAGMSSNLVDLLFEDATCFPALVDSVLPLLTTAEASSFTAMPSLRSEATDPDVVDQYPGKVLDVLYAVLSEDVREWPYEADKVLERIGEADTSLRNDARFIELNRRWNSR